MNKLKIVGMSEANAVKSVKTSGLSVRIICRDGIHMVTTRDYNLTRINLTVDKGIVIKADLG